MHLYLALWAEAFVALIVAIPITAIIYQLMGDGLELNGWITESLTALAVSAGQAGGFILQRWLADASTPGFGFQRSITLPATIFMLSLWLGYQLTHLTSWDWLEYLIFGLVDACLVLTALFVFHR